MFDWQMACALGIVAVATGLLVRRALLYIHFENHNFMRRLPK